MSHAVDSFKNRFSRKKHEDEMNALRNGSGPKVLVDFARNSDFSDIRLEATNLISDESVLVDIAQKDSNKRVRMAAIAKIRDEFVLEKIASDDSNRSVRQVAENRLRQLGYR